MVSSPASRRDYGGQRRAAARVAALPLSVILCAAVDKTDCEENMRLGADGVPFDQGVFNDYDYEE
jgi:hypothetical protein